MPPTKTIAPIIDPDTGLSREQALQALARLEASSSATDVRELSDEERVIASWLRERDHLDGCPSIDDERVASRAVEAYDETVIAPGKVLRGLGITAGQTVLIVRCLKCGGIRHLKGTVREKLTESLLSIAGESPALGDLDESL
jgi:hypothetical protein